MVVWHGAGGSGGDACWSCFNCLYRRNLSSSLYCHQCDEEREEAAQLEKELAGQLDDEEDNGEGQDDRVRVPLIGHL